MASKTGMFMDSKERESLILELKHHKGGDTGTTTGTGTGTGTTTGGVAADAPFGTGCLTCGLDDDHANLLLCEGCNDEYHTYCLDPPLKAVPTGDWFCGKYHSSRVA
jgi:hypothetical protein